MDGFGPNDPEVLRFLAQVSRLTPDEARALARLRPPDEGLNEQRERLLDRAALMTDRADPLAAARAAIAGGSRVGGTPWFGRGISELWSRRIPPRNAAVMSAALPALLDAIGALVVRDVLDPGEFALLWGPWGQVISGRTASA